MRMDEEQYLSHYGVLRKSGRYPWGSGSSQPARNQTFLDTIAGLEKEGHSQAEIAKMFSSKEHPMTSTNIRQLKAIAKQGIKEDQMRQAKRYQDKGMSNVAIGQRMNMNESSVRALLAPAAKEKAAILNSTTDMLRRQVAEKGYIDVGVGVNYDLNITDDKLKLAVAALQEEGYKKHSVSVPQLGTGKDTSTKVLGGPDSKYPQPHEIRAITEHSDDGGRSFFGLEPPISISSKRIGINYAEDGGDKADGVIYVRPGVKDLHMGANQYAQVRIKVDDTHYLKGMAVKKEGLPDGVDLVFNTNKSNSGNKLDAMKPLKDDVDNPFGSVVRQLQDEHGKVTSAMNLVNDKDDWANWSKSLSSQVLSKQAPPLAKAQLAMTFERKQKEFEEIKSLTNPSVKKKLLDSFADDVDASAIHLKAASLPGQATHVIMPVNEMKKGEIYAPNYANGTRVALIRYPHGGTFEIPELTVNNRNPAAQKLLGKQAEIAVGIHHTVAERLSGADFDGDTVLVIPNNKGLIKSTPALDGLRGFDSKDYKIKDVLKDEHGNIIDHRVMTDANTQTEMGKITNLISDMTIRGANTSEMAQAIRHSMVVIDAAKHGLDYKASAQANGINGLKAKYQHDTLTNGKGASTLITRAKSAQYVNKRRAARANEGGAIDRTTGKLRFVDTGETRTAPDRVHKRTGEIIPGKTTFVQEKSTKLAEADDAHTLSSGTVIEGIYANHSNSLKALANEARLASLDTPTVKKKPSAEATYADAVTTLNSKLNVALRNAPREREAQRLGNAVVRMKRQATPNMDGAQLRKVKAQALAEARTRVGAKKQRIEITPLEWEAIQANAISPHKLDQILANSDIEKVKVLATPKTPKLMTAAKTSRAKQMLETGYTQAEIADALGVSVSTLKTSVA